MAEHVCGGITSSLIALNDLKAGCCYVEKKPDETNWPLGENSAAFVFTYRRGGAMWQIFFGLFRTYFYIRSSENQSTLSSWRRMDNFGYNTLEGLATALKPLLGLS